MKTNKEMIKWAKDLFPINRSLTGKGVMASLKYFKAINPELQIYNFKSNTNVYDWKIPYEWDIKDAYIEHESGKKFAEFNKNNLSVLNYSVPINKYFSRNEIKKFIYTDKERPNAIPYVTSYYKKNWGFCMPLNEVRKMPKGNYKAYIDSRHYKGNINYAEAILEGKSKREIFFSSYICHPSMANNELSGPVLLNALIQYIKEIKNRNFTYRFVLLPETIGSILYINKNLEELKKHILSGYVLSCVGDERGYSYIPSRKGNTLSDITLKFFLKDKKNYKEYTFLDRGSDERQYCWPGVDLPISVFCKSKFGEYPEYHTSDDDFKVVTNKGLNQSYTLMKKVIDSFENSVFPQSTIICEPNLSKRNLYPTISKKNNQMKSQILLDVLTHCDSKNNVFTIAYQMNLSLKKVKEALKVLYKHNLIK